MVTRAQIAAHYDISTSKVRRILRALQIQPDHIDITSKGLPIYYYQQLVYGEINKYLQLLKQKLQNKQCRCCVCKKMVPQSNMVGTRCIDCFVQKNCKKLIYGPSWWQRTSKPNIIIRAIEYLKKFI